MRKVIVCGAFCGLLSACAGGGQVQTVCADLAPLQPLVKTAEQLVPNPKIQLALEAAQALEQNTCANPAVLQAVIDQLNAAIVSSVQAKS